VRRWFVRRLCATLFVFLVFPRYLIVLDCQISFDLVQIESMTLASSTLQIRRHGYSGDLNINIVICVGICTLPFYAINMDVVSLFTNSSFLFLANLHYIDALYQFEWMNIIYFVKKKHRICRAHIWFFYFSLFKSHQWFFLVISHINSYNRLSIFICSIWIGM